MRSPFIRTSRRGLSLVELMISLAITAMLLTAVAAAFSASSQAIEVNDRFFRATQAGRVSMHQMLTDVRRCAVVVDVQSDALTVIRSVEELPVREYQYRYIPATADEPGKLVLKIIPDGEDPDDLPQYVLARNVSSMSFDYEEDDINGDGLMYITRVSIVTSIQVGDSSILLSGSAVPRRTIRY